VPCPGGIRQPPTHHALRVVADGGAVVEEESPVEVLGTDDEGRVAAT
jgi:hypothetical protein